ncbi:MAG: hypothetical protein NZ700_10695, partial [Gemmataceae bacterium]|nr:hypothetical protein [Gemmataceae bacterium]MDW8264457.1 ATP-binding protein [Gemmataceae bacterium]
MPLVGKVGEFFRGRGRPAAGLVLAVSGGADSVALVRAVLELGAEPPLVVAHLNHQLRGAESDADEAFVRGLCEALRPWGPPPPPPGPPPGGPPPPPAP